MTNRNLHAYVLILLSLSSLTYLKSGALARSLAELLP